jgi:thiamine-phosphate pyrophosphorylase
VTAISLPPWPRRGIYVLTPDDGLGIAHLVQQVHQVLAGGAAAVQLRSKSLRTSSRLAAARALAGLCHANRVPLIVNDDAELAAEAGAAGVHIGRDDGALVDARRLLGPACIVGVSCYDSLSRATDACAMGADYVAFGSVYQSTSKPEATRCALSVLTAAAAQLPVPVVAIGGITPENARTLVAAGASMLAVISAVFAAPDPAAATRAFAALFADARG